MAAKKKAKTSKTQRKTVSTQEVKMEDMRAALESLPATQTAAVTTVASGGDELERLDPAEEKVLDWILKGVVGFVLGWLGLSILLVAGGFFKLWG